MSATESPLQISPNLQAMSKALQMYLLLKTIYGCWNMLLNALQSKVCVLQQ